MSNTYWIQFIYSTKLTEARKKNNAWSISVCKIISVIQDDNSSQVIL